MIELIPASVEVAVTHHSSIEHAVRYVAAHGGQWTVVLDGQAVRISRLDNKQQKKQEKLRGRKPPESRL